MADELKYYVWREVDYGNNEFRWQEAVTIPLTKEEAESTAFLLGRMRPEISFLASMGRPTTITAKTFRKKQSI